MNVLMMKATGAVLRGDLQILKYLHLVYIMVVIHNLGLASESRYILKITIFFYPSLKVNLILVSVIFPECSINILLFHPHVTCEHPLPG